ncbi:MAG: hypothetical protein QXK73_04685 [Candidatus Bathyarchaeia archaeon]
MRMVSIVERDFLIEFLRSIFKKTLHSTLGGSASEAVLFFLKKGLSRDPFDVFWEDPRAFYRGMERVFGVGAEVLIKLLVSRINSEFGLNISPGHFLDLMRNGDQSSIEEIRSLIKKVAKLYESEYGVNGRVGKVPAEVSGSDEAIS